MDFLPFQFAIIEEMASTRITESSIAPRQKRSNYIVNIEDWIVAFLKVVEPLYYFFFLAKLQLTRKTKKKDVGKGNENILRVKDKR